MTREKLVNVINCEGTVLGTFGRSSIASAEELAKTASMEKAGVPRDEGGTGTHQLHGIVTVSDDSGIRACYHKGKRLKK